MINNNNMEYERKFLVKDEYLDTVKTWAIDKIEIKQTYISFSPEVRVREIQNERISRGRKYHTMTIKKKQDDGRYEKEIKIRKGSYLDLYRNKEGVDIYKTRYNIIIENGLIAELDIYRDFNLVLVEVEFENVTDMKNFTRPYWFGHEATGSELYKIKNLARGEIKR